MIRSQADTPNDSQDLSKFIEDIKSSEEFDDKEDLLTEDKLSSGNQVILQQFLDLTQLDL